MCSAPDPVNSGLERLGEILDVTNSSIVQYYERRAREYDQMWQRDEPQRRAEQSTIAEALKGCLKNQHVLEVACGTGFWTGFAAEVAARVCGIDASPEMLALARSKRFPLGRVEFRLGDAYALEKVSGDFNAGLANFWFSHIPKTRIQEFLAGFHRRIGPGAAVFMADNVYLPGVGGRLIEHPGLEDTYKLRELADGSQHRILKNYYDAEALQRILGPLSTDLEIHIGECFWWVRYRARLK